MVENDRTHFDFGGYADGDSEELGDVRVTLTDANKRFCIFCVVLPEDVDEKVPSFVRTQNEIIENGGVVCCDIRIPCV